MRIARWWIVVAVASLLVPAMPAARAAAETVNCTVIGSLPYTISSSGIYCLTGNLATSIVTGSAITVNADNVVIDLNGHVLSNTGARTPTQARGIYGHDHRDVTVKNGTVRLFHTCVWLDETVPATTNRTHIVEDLKVENCRARGMWIIGQSSTVRRNVVRDIGGGTDDTPHWGINVQGQGSQVLDNLVHHVAGTASFQSIGIEVGDEDVMVVNNRVSDVDQGILFGQFGTSGWYRDNLVNGAGTPYVPNGTGQDAGNNRP
jgi:hypothetical protein